ncbi:unnamed protein product [Bursaphelenchus okinawaensis]|uniref:glutathione transferase n=1 Tax=Bursaphelenchus okinawaensis TaxID=465554 RepID=A0A811KEZ1_9BILA|nr:unnamed protein product [Bursaphelenchus okinawaensis]CAG9102017.1 unnamed protein product [Bursaphelenchus okinawaensis]
MFCCRRHDARMSKYRLQYFDVRGLGEGIRMIFQYEGVVFEDSRVTMDEWTEVKETARTGMLPQLTLDDRFQLAQSYAIGRFLGKQFGLHGKTEWEAALIDQYSGFLKDFMIQVNPYLFVLLGRTKGDKKKMRKTIFQPAMATFCPQIVTILNNAKSGYLLPSGITWVDFFYVEYFTSLRNLEGNSFKKYREIVLYQEKVHGLPTVADYVKIRPKSQV